MWKCFEQFPCYKLVSSIHSKICQTVWNALPDGIRVSPPPPPPLMPISQEQPYIPPRPSQYISACTWVWTHILCVPRWGCYPTRSQWWMCVQILEYYSRPKYILHCNVSPYIRVGALNCLGKMGTVLWRGQRQWNSVSQSYFGHFKVVTS